MRLLALTTSTPRFEAALIEGSDVRVLGYDGEKAHGERMFAVIDALLGELDRERIDAIACDVGPGSFTGVRVGLAAAKGIAFALGVPLVPIGSLEAMAAEARQIEPSAGSIVAVLDAKRGELFHQSWPGGAPGYVSQSEAHQIVRPGVFFCGARLGLGEARIDGVDGPSAAIIGRLAAGRVAAAPSLDEVEPVYVRAPDAKLPKQTRT